MVLLSIAGICLLGNLRGEGLGEVSRGSRRGSRGGFRIAGICLLGNLRREGPEVSRGSREGFGIAGICQLGNLRRGRPTEASLAFFTEWLGRRNRGGMMICLFLF